MFSKYPAGTKARYRVISDNDYAGDPDGLFQLAHLVLSPAVDVVGVIGSNFRGAEFFGHAGRGANASAEKALEVHRICNREDIPVVSGSNGEMTSPSQPLKTAATDMIIEAAMTASDLPLFVVCGGSLTAIASAWLLEPRIAENLVLVWIGGPEHEGLASAPPNPDPMEYNLSIDLAAAQTVFNHSDLKIWQIPRDAYRQANASLAELMVKLEGNGELGDYLYGAVAEITEKASASMMLNLGETYILGDSPLVLVTALQSNFHPDASSSKSVVRKRPSVTDEGAYGDATDYDIRVFTQLDNRFMLEDMFAKFTLLARSQRARIS